MTPEHKALVISDEMVSVACDAFLEANKAIKTVGFKEMRAALAAIGAGGQAVVYVKAATLRHHIDSGNSQTGAVLHKEQGELEGERDVPLFTYPPQPAERVVEALKMADLPALIERLETLTEESANAYDDWWAAQGVTTLRRRYKTERDAALAELRAHQVTGKRELREARGK